MREEEMKNKQKEEETPNPFNSLPDEALLHLFSFFKPPILASVHQVDKRFNAIAKDLSLKQPTALTFEKRQEILQEAISKQDVTVLYDNDVLFSEASERDLKHALVQVASYLTNKLQFEGNSIPKFIKLIQTPHFFDRKFQTWHSELRSAIPLLTKFFGNLEIKNFAKAISPDLLYASIMYPMDEVLSFYRDDKLPVDFRNGRISCRDGEKIFCKLTFSHHNSNGVEDRILSLTRFLNQKSGFEDVTDSVERFNNMQKAYKYDKTIEQTYDSFAMHRRKFVNIFENWLEFEEVLIRLNNAFPGAFPAPKKNEQPDESPLPSTPRPR